MQTLENLLIQKYTTKFLDIVHKLSRLMLVQMVAPPTLGYV